jgi:diguanylate cyclase (GGDEF)-like protein/PAS domain S-box-containing protein
MKKTIENTEKTKVLILHYLIGVFGVCLFLYSAYNLQFSLLGINFLIIAAITIIFGSRISLNIQPLKFIISVVDVFIFLTLLLFGSEAAICLVSIETYITSFKYTKRLDLRLFNTGTMTLSIFTSAKLSQFLFGDVLNLQNGINLRLVITLLFFVLIHYLVNSLLITLSQAFRLDQPIFKVWRTNYVWMFLPFLACGSVALVAANAIHTSGIFAFILVIPIIGIIYFSYYSQQGKLQAITEKVQQSEKFLGEITESEERFRSAFSNAPIGMALISTNGNWLQTNQSLCSILGYTSEDFADKQFSDFLHHQELVNFNSNIGLLLQRKTTSYQSEIRFCNSKGDEIWTQTSISHAGDKDSSRLICQIQDITARQKAEAKLKHDAFYDSLTDLANRTLLMRKLTEVIVKAKQDKYYSFVVLFVDIDRFKLVNDSSGHGVGDGLLIAVANRLKKCLPEYSTLARLGSDEFFILLESDSFDVSQTEELAIEIQSQICSDIRILSYEINVTASIGIVNYETVHQTGEDVLRDAGTALHLAKKQGRSKYIFFDQEMREKSINQIQLEKDLQKAVERHELFLVYQPIISLQNNTLNGFEALVRWNHPKRGLVSPIEFIQLAEENGVIIELGKFVIEESCRQLNEWQETYSKELPITISVNVSAKQLLQKNFLADVVDTLEKYKIKPMQIKIEITESVVVENSDIVISALRQFRALGINLSMDDFGTGYSSLSYLHQLPISTLKIDRSFISKMTNKKDTTEIVRTILMLAKNLKLNVVAEGIENKIQLDLLKEFECELGQGYYFAKPLNVSDATKFVDESVTDDSFFAVKNTEILDSSVLH